MNLQKNKKHIFYAMGMAAALLAPAVNVFAGNPEPEARAIALTEAGEMPGIPAPMASPLQTGAPTEPSAGVQTAVPTAAVPITPSIAPSKQPKPERPKSGKTKVKVKRLGKVSGVKLTRYSTNSVKITWKKVKAANYYHVYCGGRPNGKYRRVGTTADNHYMVQKLKNHKTYYFYVTAAKKKGVSESDSKPSGKPHMKMKAYQRKVIFAGDSITQGIGYNFFKWKMNGVKKTVAYRGLNTVTFHTKRIFGGRTGLQKVIAERPYRVYMMMGVNEIHYRPADTMISEYKGMVQAIKQACPNTDIVLCAIAPVTKGERMRHNGYWQIPKFNRKLKTMAKQVGTRYLDYTGFLKDSGGYLKAEYAERDGYHWKAPAYGKFARVVERFEEEIDR